jgi:hypothetical protein
MSFLTWFFGLICGWFSVAIFAFIWSKRVDSVSVYKKGFVHLNNKSWWMFGDHPFWDGERVDGLLLSLLIKNENGDWITVAKYKTNK